MNLRCAVEGSEIAENPECAIDAPRSRTGVEDSGPPTGISFRREHPRTGIEARRAGARGMRRGCHARQPIDVSRRVLERHPQSPDGARGPAGPGILEQQRSRGQGFSVERPRSTPRGRSRRPCRPDRNAPSRQAHFRRCRPLAPSERVEPCLPLTLAPVEGSSNRWLCLSIERAMLSGPQSGSGPDRRRGAAPLGAGSWPRQRPPIKVRLRPAAGLISAGISSAPGPRRDLPPHLR